MTQALDPWYLDNLVCPRDHLGLQYLEPELLCPFGHRYPVVDQVPVMLLEDVEQTIGIAQASLREAKSSGKGEEQIPRLYLDSLGISDKERQEVLELAHGGNCRIDPVVSYLVGATSGYSYKHLIGALNSYPIPDLRLPDGNGQTLLELGCNWGRWCIAAARKGYNVVGIDPSLGAIMAAQRVNMQLGLSIKYLVADARFLPFAANTYDNIFSYSVLQHLSRDNVKMVLAEVARVLKPGGTSLIQMANVLGLRCLYHQARRRFREARGFEVRYWSVPALKRTFTEIVGESKISVDCYFGLGLQAADWKFMPPQIRFAIAASEFLRKASAIFPFLIYVADSVYVKSTKANHLSRSP